MPEAEWLSSAHVKELVARLVEKTARDYRVAPEEAERTIRETLARDPAFAKAAARQTDPRLLERTRAFRDAASRARHRIYYSLRRYRGDAADAEAGVEALASLPPHSPRAARDEAARRVMLAHASMRERLGNLREFHEQLFALAGGPRTVLDVGCGVQPLAFPFEGAGRSVELYVAADKDAAAVRAVEAHARFLGKGCVRALRWDIAQGWGAVAEAAGVGTFDLALLLKLVPVVKRREPHLVKTLAGAPARRMLVTGSAMSMTKRRSVRRRERAALARFIGEAGLRIAGELETPDEVGWMVARA